MKNILQKFRKYLRGLYGNICFVCRAIRDVRRSNVPASCKRQFFTILGLQLLHSLSFSVVVSYAIALPVFVIGYLPGAAGWIGRPLLAGLLTYSILVLWYPRHRYYEWHWFPAINLVDKIIIPLIPILLSPIFAFWHPFGIIGFLFLTALHIFITRRIITIFVNMFVQHYRQQTLDEFASLIGAGIAIVKRPVNQPSPAEAFQRSNPQS